MIIYHILISHITRRYTPIRFINEYSIEFQTLQLENSCYELLEDYEEVRDKAKYWLEGVGILIVGSFGLLGNVLSIFIFRRSRGNKGFHTLLIM